MSPATANPSASDSSICKDSGDIARLNAQQAILLASTEARRQLILNE
jgi:hypothetical protein